MQLCSLEHICCLRCRVHCGVLLCCCVLCMRAYFNAQQTGFCKLCSTIFLCLESSRNLRVGLLACLVRRAPHNCTVCQTRYHPLLFLEKAKSASELYRTALTTSCCTLLLAVDYIESSQHCFGDPTDIGRGILMTRRRDTVTWSGRD